MTPAARRAVDLLERVIGSLHSAEHRDGQLDMVRHVADAIDSRRPLVIQAGTGTGKTLGYLVPVLAAGQTAVGILTGKSRSYISLNHSHEISISRMSALPQKLLS